MYSTNIVHGLYYYPLVINQNDQQLIDELDKNIWINIGNRTVQYYGYIHDSFHRGAFRKYYDLPDYLLALKNILLDICLKNSLIDHNYHFNQCLVNNYNRNQGIHEHIDMTTCGSVIGCFTIGSGTTIQFRKENELFNLYVEPNSLYIMSSDARYLWKHSIPINGSDFYDNQIIKRKRRISITFRMVSKIYILE